MGAAAARCSREAGRNPLTSLRRVGPICYCSFVPLHLLLYRFLHTLLSIARVYPIKSSCSGVNVSIGLAPHL